MAPALPPLADAATIAKYAEAAKAAALEKQAEPEIPDNVSASSYETVEAEVDYGQRYDPPDMPESLKIVLPPLPDSALEL